MSPRVYLLVVRPYTCTILVVLCMFCRNCRNVVGVLMLLVWWGGRLCAGSGGWGRRNLTFFAFSCWEWASVKEEREREGEGGELGCGEGTRW